MVVAAVVSAAATIGGAAISANSANRASDAVAAGNRRAREEQARTRAENLAILNPYVQRGNTAGDTINSFLGLNGSQAGQEAFNTWLNSSDYKFTTDRGVGAITGNAATRGMLNSGATLKALNQFGQDNAQRYVGNWLSALGTQQGVGANSANALVSSNQNAANNISGLYQNTGQTQANAALAQGNAWSGALSSLGSLGAYGFGSGAFGQSSYGAAAHSGVGAASGQGISNAWRGG